MSYKGQKWKKRMLRPRGIKDAIKSKKTKVTFRADDKKQMPALSGMSNVELWYHIHKALSALDKNTQLLEFYLSQII